MIGQKSLLGTTKRHGGRRQRHQARKVQGKQIRRSSYGTSWGQSRLPRFPAWGAAAACLFHSQPFIINPVKPFPSSCLTTLSNITIVYHFEPIHLNNTNNTTTHQPTCLSQPRKSHALPPSSDATLANIEPFSDICKIILAIVLPPLGVFLERGCNADFFINILLTVLGYIPGIIHAL